MKTILLATHNQGKIKRYHELFAEIVGLNLVTLDELKINFKVDEPFLTPEENSAHKAREYGRLSNLLTIAIDEAVTTDFLPENEQPGVLVRRFKENRELSDTEVLDLWKSIFEKYPNKELRFIWDFSLSFYNPESAELKTVKAVQLDSVARNFSKIIDPGYPMSSFLIPQDFTKTYSELSKDEYLIIDKKNLKSFLDFVKEIIKI